MMDQSSEPMSAQKNLRYRMVQKLSSGIFDVAIIGAGINGAVTAAALASTGTKVALIDQHDFAANTSSNSSNLIWGGIKYMEGGEFGLVNKLCKCRNQLKQAFPSRINELRFMTSVHKGFRYPNFLMYMGAWLYWVIGRFATRRPLYLSRSNIKQHESLININHVNGGFEYSDCQLADGDARFVFGFVQSCLKSGGIAANYLESTNATRVGRHWLVDIKDKITGQTFKIKTRMLVNACGPEVDRFNQLTGQSTQHRHVYSNGVHLIVRRLSNDYRALAFFARDGRLFFITPMGSRSCIGTTDTRTDQPTASISNQDRAFILDNANEMLDLDHPLTIEDIISERRGVRPLVVKNEDKQSDWLQMSRKHQIEIDSAKMHISIFGGKLTDCLNVGEEMVDAVSKLGIDLKTRPAQWYGEPQDHIKILFFNYATQIKLDWLTDPDSSQVLSKRLWRRYGDTATQIARNIVSNPDEARLLYPGSDYTYAELIWAAKDEMVMTLDDFFRRRTDIATVIPKHQIIQPKILKEIAGILFPSDTQNKIDAYLKNKSAHHEHEKDSLLEQKLTTN